MGTEVSKQTREQSEQDLSSLTKPTGTSTTSANDSCAKISEEQFFSNVFAKLKTFENELISNGQTITNLSACFSPPPAAEYLGHPFNKFEDCFAERFLQKFKNVQNFPNSKVVALKVTNIITSQDPNQESFTVSADLESTPLLELHLKFGQAQKYQLEVRTISFYSLLFVFVRDLSSYSFPVYSLELKNLQVTGVMTITRAEGDTVKHDVCFKDKNGLCLQNGEELREIVKSRASLLQSYLEFLRDPEWSKLLCKMWKHTTEEMELRLPDTTLTYSSQFNSWIPSPSSKMHLSNLVLDAVSMIDTKMRIQVNYLTGSPSSVTIHCKLQEANTQRSTLCDVCISMEPYSGSITTESPYFHDLKQIPYSNPITRFRLPTARSSIQDIKQSIFNNVGELELAFALPTLLKFLDSMPNMILDACAASWMCSISFWPNTHTYLASQHSKQVFCNFIYHPALVDTEYNFFQFNHQIVCTNLTVSSYFFFKIVESVDLEPLIFNLGIDPGKPHIYASNKQALKSATNLYQFLLGCNSFLTSLTDLKSREHELTKCPVSHVQLQFNPAKKHLEFKLKIQDTEKHSLQFDLNTGIATLESLSGMGAARFWIKQNKKLGFMMARVLADKSFADTSVEFS